MFKFENSSEFKGFYEGAMEWAENPTIAYAQALRDMGFPIQKQCVIIARKFDEATAEAVIDHLIEMEVLHELEDHGIII